MAFEVCRPKLKHCTKTVTVVDSHSCVLITDHLIQLLDVKIPQYWIIIMVSLKMVGRGKKQHRIFFLAGDSASLVGGRKQRRKIGSFMPDHKRSHAVIFLPASPTSYTHNLVSRIHKIYTCESLNSQNTIENMLQNM